MSFAARLGPLTEELIQSLRPSLQGDAKATRAARDAALQALKSHTFLRTNQFEVKHSLDGLEERFRINHRDGLADALRERLDALDRAPEKWHPEILSLLLELSDQPTFKTRLSDLYALRPDEEAPEKSLKWEDIAREERWDEDPDLWATVRYANSSDEESYHDGADDSASTASTGDSDIVGTTAEDLIISPQDAPLLESVKEAQHWRIDTPQRNSSGQARLIAVSEVQVLREVLFMLQGLPTTLFHSDSTVVPAFQTPHLAWETHKALLNSFAEYGRHLTMLRDFAEMPRPIPLTQAFQACVSDRLRDFDARIAQIEARFVCPGDQVVVSLIAVKNELDAPVSSLVSLADIVAQFVGTQTPHSFHYLELLFSAANRAQEAGMQSTYEFLARIFMECFVVYLRPIRGWMDEGHLLPDDEIFFVTDTAKKVSWHRVWQDRFTLRRKHNGALHAPDFLHPALSKIFNAGKSIVILKQLGGSEAKLNRQAEQEPALDFETICPRGVQLAPFADLFDAAFERWIQSKYRKTSTILIDILFRKYKLSSRLDALQRLYFMSDGSAAAAFCDELFATLDALKPSWHDRYALTALGQDSYASIDSSYLTVDVEPEGRHVPIAEARDSVRAALPHISFSYRLAWPIQMIISEESMSHYRATFTLLLQVKRALYALHKTRLSEAQWMGELLRESSLFYSARNQLVWFCTTILSYLTSLVLAPNILLMHRDLEAAQDVDAMISIHASAMKLIIDEACLGTRLSPIRDCMLDVFDLAIKLEQVHGTDIAGGAEAVAWYSTVLTQIKADFGKHLRFICGGLRSVARASGDTQSAKWDLLAEMLQSGSRDDRRY
ncbi:putative gamma-tubulin complex component GCP5 [Stachybotrys elegans]|uniref:Spindle pole body component n=1 Tax=Stachybotrys elegans TaxID=80388 RepID=A0A8K0SMM0_9HYPO|nr:putative gamma-tubulin complex component GCP5 [Stachybotrys elegans]